ncbi:MAG: PHP domain-containing protein, partial [Candidatus Acidiferrales bacterium]
YLGRNHQSAVSLHGHTNRSKEILDFIPQLAKRLPMLHAALEKQCKRSTIPVDFSRAYWTPPVTPKRAYEIERNQIQGVLGLGSLVSLTDHDKIDAPVLLRTVAETAQMPVSLEWSVPFAGTSFHIGVHNLPSANAQAIVADLNACTRNPIEPRIVELLAMLHEIPDVLIVFNHPLWNQACTGEHRDGHILERFLRLTIRYLHAFEFNATRSAKENKGVLKLADRWQRPIVSGGDRHGCDASGALNLTRCETFSEFVDEIRVHRRSHVLVMPQYGEPEVIRTTRTLLDVIREYPEYPEGMRRWDDRIFHPDASGGTDQPISSLWKAPPAYVERTFTCIRVLEHTAVQRILRHVFRSSPGSYVPREISPEAAS